MAIALPEVSAVADALTMLLGRKPDLRVGKLGGGLGADPKPLYVAYWLNDAAEQVGAVIVDVPGALVLGGGFMMMPPGALQDQLRAGAPNEAVVDALAEVMNTLAGIVNRIPGNSHFRSGPVEKLAGSGPVASRIDWLAGASAKLEIVGDAPLSMYQVLFAAK